MEGKKINLKNSLAAGGVVLLLLFGIIGPLGAKRADALFTTAVTIPPSVTATNPLTGHSAISMDVIRDYILRLAVRTVTRAILQATTKQVVNWIQGNGGKNVGYVSNLKAAMRREADVSAGEFLNSLAKVNLCGNISAYLQLSLRLPSFGQRFACSLTDIVANVNNFYQDFQKGGWPAFFRIALEPQNNVYGAYLIALDTKIGIEDNAQKFKGLALQKSYPFEGFKVPKQVCDIIPPEQASANFEMQYLGETPQPIPQVTPEEAAQINTEQQYLPEEARGQYQTCHTEYDTKTPGQLISDQLSKATGIGEDYLVSAKDIDEMLGTILNALLNKIITTTFSSGSGSSASYGQGISDNSLSNLPAENLNQNMLVQQVNNGIYSADAALSAVDAKLINTRRELFDYQRQLANLLYQNPNPETSSATAAQISDLKQKIKSDQDAITAVFTQKSAILSDQYRLISLRNAFANLTSATDVQALAQQLPQIMLDLGNITQNMENVPLPTVSIGNPKRDTLEFLRGSEGNTRRSMTLLDDTVAEIDRLATSTTSSASQWQQLLLRRPAVLIQKTILQTSLDKILQSQLDVARAGDSEMNNTIINVLNQMQTVNQQLSDTASFIANVDGLRRSIWSTVFIISF